MVGSRQSIPSWVGAAAARVDFEGNTSTMLHDGKAASPMEHSKPLSDANLGFGERALSAAGAAVISAILVNPLDIAKVSSSRFPQLLCFLRYFQRTHLLFLHAFCVVMLYCGFCFLKTQFFSFCSFIIFIVLRWLSTPIEKLIERFIISVLSSPAKLNKFVCPQYCFMDVFCTYGFNLIFLAPFAI